MIELGVALIVFFLLGCCCIGHIAETNRADNNESERYNKRMKDYKDYEEKVTIRMTEKRTDPSNIDNTQSVSAPAPAPRSGSHIAQFKTVNGGTFTADLSLFFIKDEENGEGYYITGKRVDKFGQTVIQDGFMCNTGDAYWKEKYISSNARHIVRDRDDSSDSSSASYWDGPRVEDHCAITVGKFNIYDEENQGRMTFEGIWHSDHVAFPAGTVCSKSLIFGKPVMVGSGSEGQNNVVDIPEAIPVEIELSST